MAFPPTSIRLSPAVLDELRIVRKMMRAARSYRRTVSPNEALRYAVGLALDELHKEFEARGLDYKKAVARPIRGEANASRKRVREPYRRLRNEPPDFTFDISLDDLESGAPIDLTALDG